MRVVVYDKYYLRDLHREIDFFDRKLFHVNKLEEFESEDQRRDAIRRLQSRRDLLAKRARSLAANGIEYEKSELPRSFVGDGVPSAPKNKPAPRIKQSISVQPLPEKSISVLSSSRTPTIIPSYFAEQNTRLSEQKDSSPLASWHQDLEAYKRRRQKVQAARRLAS